MAERIAARTYYTEAKIGAGSSLSNVIDGKGYRLTRIFMPAAWDAASLTFQEAPSPDGTFQNLYDDTTTSVEGSIPISAGPIEVSIPVSAGKNTVILENKDRFAGMAYFKIRSGTSSLAVTQAADRTIGLLFVGV